MFKRLKQWYRSKTDAARFWLITRWTKGRGLSIVQIVTIDGTDYIATAHGTFREIGKIDLVPQPAQEISNEPKYPTSIPTTSFTV